MIPLFVFLGGLIVLYCQRRRLDRASQAFDDWRNMGALFRELLDDPFMTSEKWKEWLPYFQFADERFAKLHPYIKEFVHYADLVREEIDDLPCQMSGSS